MNPKRRPLVAGNWKMNHGASSGVELATEVAKIARHVTKADLVIAPPFTVLAACAEDCSEAGVGLAGQNLYPSDIGAFTGEVSGPMLIESGCTWVILGHSERRQYFAESDAFVAEKAAAAFKVGLTPILCVGETLSERDSGSTIEVVRRQMAALVPVLAANPKPAAVAYEPVWAIGTGKNAGPNEAEEVHAAIRDWLARGFHASSPELADRTRLLYGGSVKADNAAALFGCPNVDGALVGGASLDITSFGAIARVANALASHASS